MDPDQVWQELSAAYCGNEDTQWDRISELADNLLHWLMRGGCPPKITGNRAFDKLVAFRTLEALMEWNVFV